jgi:5-formaminoimidazole-4-carboxamide-1-beta-D-ribofuranosyl 5'-monophosphate synthetase
MTTISYQVATWLQSAGFGTLGTDIFVNEIPDDINGLWTVNMGGQMNNYVPIEEAVVNIYSKDIKSELAVDRLERIKHTIHRQLSQTIGTTFVYTFLIIGDIESVERDNQFEKIYKMTVQAVHRDTNLIS